MHITDGDLGDPHPRHRMRKPAASLLRLESRSIDVGSGGSRRGHGSSRAPPLARPELLLYRPPLVLSVRRA
jgi:hypothetical protein